MGKWNGKEDGNKYLIAYRIKNIMSYEKRNGIQNKIKFLGKRTKLKLNRKEYRMELKMQWQEINGL